MRLARVLTLAPVRGRHDPGNAMGKCFDNESCSQIIGEAIQRTTTVATETDLNGGKIPLRKTGPISHWAHNSTGDFRGNRNDRTGKNRSSGSDVV